MSSKKWNVRKAPEKLNLVQVRRIKQHGLDGIGVEDIMENTEFVCNELNMDRAMAVADNEALVGNSCILIPFTFVCPGK